VDTGADLSVIMPADFEALGLDPERNLEKSSMRAAGLTSETVLYVEPCMIELVHIDGVVDRVEVPLHFAASGMANVRSQSLLGWDVLGRYRCTVERASGLVALEYPEGPEAIS
jgi:hypothetical protein